MRGVMRRAVSPSASAAAQLHPILCSQHRSRTAYRYYEDQMKTTLPKSPAKEPNFVVRDGVKIDKSKWERSFSDQFYNTTSMSGALQLINAKDVPVPPEHHTLPTFNEMTTASLQAAVRGSEAYDKFRNMRPTEKPKMTDEQLQARKKEALQRAKEVEKASAALGQRVMNHATTSNELERDQLASTFMSDGVRPLMLDEDMEMPTMQEMKKSSDKWKATPQPRLEDFSGEGPAREARYLAAMQEWEEKDKLARTSTVEYVKKRAQPGAPVMHEWGRSDEAHHNAGRQAFQSHYLSQPGWDMKNFGVMYYALKTGKQAGTISTATLRAPSWQL